MTRGAAVTIRPQARPRRAGDDFGGNSTVFVDDSAENLKREKGKEKDLADAADRRNRKPVDDENPGQPDGWATSRRRRRRAAPEFPMDTVDHADITDDLQQIEDKKRKDLAKDLDRRNRKPDNSIENPGQPDGWATKGSSGVRARVLPKPNGFMGARVLLGKGETRHEGKITEIGRSSFIVQWADGEITRERKANYTLAGEGQAVPCNYCGKAVGAGELRDHYKDCPDKPLKESRRKTAAPDWSKSANGTAKEGEYCSYCDTPFTSGEAVVRGGPRDKARHVKNCDDKESARTTATRVTVRRIEMSSSRRGQTLLAYVLPDINSGLVVALNSGRVRKVLATTAADAMVRVSNQHHRGDAIVSDSRFRMPSNVWADDPHRTYRSLERQIAATKKSSIVEDVRAAYDESSRRLEARWPEVTDFAEFSAAVQAIGEYNSFDPARIIGGLGKLWGNQVTGVELAREGSPAMYLHGDTNVLLLVAPGLGADETDIHEGGVVRAWWD